MGRVYDSPTAGWAIFSDFNFQDAPGPCVHTSMRAKKPTMPAPAVDLAALCPKVTVFFTSFNWVFHQLDLTLSNTYASATDDTGPQRPLPRRPIPVASYTAWDVRGGHTIGRPRAFQDSKVTLAVRRQQFYQSHATRSPAGHFLDNNADCPRRSRRLGRFGLRNGCQ